MVETMSSRVQKAKQLLQIPVKEKKIREDTTVEIELKEKKPKKPKKQKRKHPQHASFKHSNKPVLTPEQTEITTKLLNIIQKNIRDAEYYESDSYVYFTIDLDNVNIKLTCSKGRLSRNEIAFLEDITVCQYTRGLIRKKVKNKLHWQRDIEGQIFGNFWSGVSIVIAARFQQRRRDQQQLEEQKQKTKLQSIISNLKE